MGCCMSKKKKSPRITNGRDSSSTARLPPSQATPIPSEDDEDNTDDNAASNRVKSRTTLIGNIKLEIIPDCATEYDLYGYQETRDIGKSPRNTYGRYSPSTDSQPSSQATTIPSEDDEDNTDDDAASKRVIDKCRTTLIDYMKPESILDCATEYGLFGYQETRDIGEEKNTSEKNRSILASVRRKGNTGYTQLKDCLTNTGQSHLVELLECTERGEEPGVLLEQIHKIATQDMPNKLKGRTISDRETVSIKPMYRTTWRDVFNIITINDP